MTIPNERYGLSRYPFGAWLTAMRQTRLTPDATSIVEINLLLLPFNDEGKTDPFADDPIIRLSFNEGRLACAGRVCYTAEPCIERQENRDASDYWTMQVTPGSIVWLVLRRFGVGMGGNIPVISSVFVCPDNQSQIEGLSDIAPIRERRLRVA